MNDKTQNDEHQKKKEAYIMASRDPWLVWRLQALRAGYVPPLLPGQIPANLAHLPLGQPQEEYCAEPLIQHATRVRLREKSFIFRAFIWLIIGFIIFCGLSFALTMTTGGKFRIGILDTLMPHMEQTHTIQMR